MSTGEPAGCPSNEASAVSKALAAFDGYAEFAVSKVSAVSEV